MKVPKTLQPKPLQPKATTLKDQPLSISGNVSQFGTRSCLPSMTAATTKTNVTNQTGQCSSKPDRSWFRYSMVLVSHTRGIGCGAAIPGTAANFNFGVRQTSWQKQ
jgi:hypothetical protein